MKINKTQENLVELFLSRTETEIACFCLHAARFCPYEAFEMYASTPEDGERLEKLFRAALNTSAQDGVSIVLSKRDLGTVSCAVGAMNVIGPEDSHPELKDIAPDETVLDDFSEALHKGWTEV